MKAVSRLILTLAGYFLFLSMPLIAQQMEIPQRVEPYQWDSPVVSGEAVAGSQAEAKITHTIRIPQAPWLRLQFGDVSLGNSSYLTIRSLKDGAVQTLNARTIAEWQFTSAYFNGDAVEVTLYVAPGDRGLSFQLEEVVVGEYVGGEPIESICDLVDDRVPSSDPRAGRIVNVGCTAWLINNGVIATAGHCLDTATATTLQFNVPPSLSDGTIQHPGPEDQYSVIQSSRNFTNGGVGNDWGVFEVNDNTQTGLQPIDAQGDSYVVKQDLGPATIRITGFGTDSDNRDRNQTQQTHTGPNAGSSGTTMRYRTDTTGGNSGSPVIDEATGMVVGVHTHGGCSSGGNGNNSGTSTFHSDFWAAINPGGNAAPTAVAEANPTTGAAPLTVNFTGSNSTDSDGTITSYSWDFGDGTSSSQADPSHVYNSAGTYTAVLTVTDDGGATDTDQVIITVTGPPNTPPTATITSPADGANFPIGATVNYSGTGTDPEDGTLGASAFTWFYTRNGGAETQFASGVTSGSETINFPGTYVLILEVVDSGGATDRDQVTITVGGAGNTPPTAVAEATPTSGTAPLTVNFTGSNSSDPDGTISSYSWDFGDGTSSTQADPTHTYTAAGTYTAVLTVTDNDGATGTDQVTITVNDAANQPPTATITAPADGATFPIGATVSYSGTGSDPEDGPLAASAFTWFYSRNGGPETQFASGVSSGSETINFPGTYTIILEVVDSGGATDRDQVTITVSGNAKLAAELDGSSYGLSEAYPNPFNPETRISFSLPQQQRVTVRVYNSLGQVVKTLIADQSLARGVHDVRWNATNEAGAQVPSGQYYLIMQAGQYSQMRKLTLMK